CRVKTSLSASRSPARRRWISRSVSVESLAMPHPLLYYLRAGGILGQDARKIFSLVSLAEPKPLHQQQFRSTREKISPACPKNSSARRYFGREVRYNTSPEEASCPSKPNNTI